MVRFLLVFIGDLFVQNRFNKLKDNARNNESVIHLLRQEKTESVEYSSLLHTNITYGAD